MQLLTPRPEEGGDLAKMLRRVVVLLSVVMLYAWTYERVQVPTPIPMRTKMYMAVYDSAGTKWGQIRSKREMLPIGESNPETTRVSFRIFWTSK